MKRVIGFRERKLSIVTAHFLQNAESAFSAILRRQKSEKVWLLSRERLLQLKAWLPRSKAELTQLWFPPRRLVTFWSLHHALKGLFLCFHDQKTWTDGAIRTTPGFPHSHLFVASRTMSTQLCAHHFFFFFWHSESSFPHSQPIRQISFQSFSCNA